MQSLLDLANSFILKNNIVSSDDVACLLHDIYFNPYTDIENIHRLHIFTTYCLNNNYVNAVKKLLSTYFCIQSEIHTSDYLISSDYFYQILKFLYINNDTNLSEIISNQRIYIERFLTYVIKFICKKLDHPIDILKAVLMNNLSPHSEYYKLATCMISIISEKNLIYIDEILELFFVFKINSRIFPIADKDMWKLKYIKSKHNFIDLARNIFPGKYNGKYNGKSKVIDKDRIIDCINNINMSMLPCVFDVIVKYCESPDNLYAKRDVYLYFYEMYIVPHTLEINKLNFDKLEKIIDIVISHMNNLPDEQIIEHKKYFQKFITKIFSANNKYYRTTDPDTHIIIETITKAKKYFMYPKKLNIENILDTR